MTGTFSGDDDDVSCFDFFILSIAQTVVFVVCWHDKVGWLKG